jgi:hypothetical protein
MSLEQEKKWYETEIGKLWLRYENAASTLSQKEADDNISWSSLKKADEAYREAKAAFLKAVRGF